MKVDESSSGTQTKTKGFTPLKGLIGFVQAESSHHSFHRQSA